MCLCGYTLYYISFYLLVDRLFVCLQNRIKIYYGRSMKRLKIKKNRH